MNTGQSCIVTINGGSSSIKFALYRISDVPILLLRGEIARIGLQNANLNFKDEEKNKIGTLKVEASDHQSAVNSLIDWLQGQELFSAVRAVGHRVVHGMDHIMPEIITPELLAELRSVIPFDPDHLPGELELIEVFRQRHPKIPQVACFDTAFHSTMPRVARLLPIPRRFDAKGIRRYGFHGLSYAYLVEELTRVAGARAAQGRVILAHLGNGASLVAVSKGKSVDTSMGFTPAGGFIMGSRPGDLDPGVAWYMMQSENLTLKQFNNLINHQSGLLGVSETSSDMQDLLTNQVNDIRAAEAVELFCYQVRKWIGAFAAVLGGLDTLVFSGGIGENVPEVRSRICDKLGFLDIELDERRNIANAPVISTDDRRVAVRVIHTDEEWMIAKMVSQILNLTKK